MNVGKEDRHVYILQETHKERRWSGNENTSSPLGNEDRNHQERLQLFSKWSD